MRPFNFYIASGLENGTKVREVRDILRAVGGECTYDWTEHGSVQAAPGEDGSDRYAVTAGCEAQGVLGADVVVVLLPGARGTHVELGVGIGSNKPVVLLAERDDLLLNTAGRDCVFYWHQNVTRVRTLAELLARIREIVGR